MRVRPVAAGTGVPRQGPGDAQKDRGLSHTASGSSSRDPSGILSLFPRSAATYLGPVLAGFGRLYSVKLHVSVSGRVDVQRKVHEIEWAI
jgi:hypothetical protein